MTLEQLKADLLYKASLDKVASGERDEKMTAGMRDVPVAKMIHAVNYIDKNLLPAIKKKSGEKSADYEFFKEVIDYLLWAIVIVDRYDHLEGVWIRQKIEKKLLQELNEYYEKELMKYVTMEDLLLGGALDAYAKGVKDRVGNLFKTTKPL